MEETYEYDEFLTTYLKSLKRDNILTLYYSIFNNVNKLNNSSYFEEDEVIELDVLELEIRELITKHEEEVNDDILNIITNKIISYISKGLYKQSITLMDNIKLSDLDKVLIMLLTVINIDPDLAITIKDELTSDENDVNLAFINLLEEYSDLTLTQCLEVIDNVGYDFKEKTITYLDKRIMSKVDTSDYSYLVKIISLDNKYGKTKIVKDFLHNGYEDLIIDFNIDSMYSNINLIKNDIEKVAYEIAATLVLSSDTRYNLSDSCEHFINFESLGYDNIKLKSLRDKLDILLNELEMRI